MQNSSYLTDGQELFQNSVSEKNDKHVNSLFLDQ